MSFFGDLNEIRILGNVTNDPEIRYTPNGTPVANFTVATNRRYKQGEEWKDEPEFHNVVAWANLAQGLGHRVKKGTRMMLTGRIQTRSWEGQDGQKRYKTEIIADDIFLIDRYERGKQEDLPDKGMPAPQQPPVGDDASGKGKDESKAKKVDDDIIDPDDLPF